MKTCREDKPYIFISYAHKDSVEVVEIINGLVSKGYNVWYDEGIDPGTEWDENIAKHIKNCSYFIAFISNNYINSKNCKDELNFSRNLEKDQLLVYIEDTSLPDGLEMRMNRIQAIFWHRYDNKEVAFEKLFSAKGIENVKLSDSAPEGFTGFTVPQNLVANSDSTQLNVSAQLNSSIQSISSDKTGSLTELDPTTLHQHDDSTSTGRKKSYEKTFGKKAIIIVGVAAALIIAVAGIFVSKIVSSNNSENPILIGMDYMSGANGKKFSPETALTYFEKEASLGDKTAAFLAGYTYNELIVKDRDKAVENAITYLEKCDDNPYALMELGNIYANDECEIGQDLDLAESYFSKAFIQTDVEKLKAQTELLYYNQACNIMAIEYYYGYYTKEDLQVAEELVLDGAKAGLPESMFLLAGYYMNDDTKEKDWDEIKNLLQKGADLGFSKSIVRLGYIYSSGGGSPYEDYQKAEKLYLKAAELGNRTAYNDLGALYKDACLSQTPDYDTAMKYFIKASEMGYALSMKNIANMYQYGNGVDANAQTAIEWYTKAYNKGRWDAANDIGNIYIDGFGNVEQDVDLAIEWYKKAAEKNFSNAYANLGKIYSFEEYDRINYDEALKWYEKSVKADNSYGCILLANYYQTNKEGIVTDYQKSLELLEKAIELGSEHAAFMLGYNYFYGESIDSSESSLVAVDEAKGIEYFKIASDFGYNLANAYLGLIYCGSEAYKGNTIENDYYKARDYLKKYIDIEEKSGAQATDIEYFELAQIYDNEFSDITADDDTIMNLYRTSAELGLGNAMVHLGLKLANSGNHDEAHEWFMKAYEAIINGDCLEYELDLFELIGLIYKDDGDYAQAYEWFSLEFEVGGSDGARQIAKLIEEGKTAGIDFPEGYTTAEAWIAEADKPDKESDN